MPKGTLSFTLPEENEEFETACKAADYRFAWEDLRNKVRSKFKYEDREALNEEELRDILNDIENEYNIKY